MKKTTQSSIYYWMYIRRLAILVLCLYRDVYVNVSTGLLFDNHSPIIGSTFFVDATSLSSGILSRPRQAILNVPNGKWWHPSSRPVAAVVGITSRRGRTSWDTATATATQQSRQKRESERYLDKEEGMNDHDDYEDGEDEWDRLERIKKELEPKLGGYRPWSIDTSYLRRRPGQYSWTSKIVILNIAMYGLQMINPNVTRMFAKRSDLILSGRQLYRLVTPIFLHGSVSHLMLNSFSLNNIGPEVERIFGGGRFLATYLVGGIVGNLASAYYTPNPSLGASGAVFGLMGAYYTFLSRNERLFGSSGQDMMGRVGSTLGMNVLFGMMSPSIDNWAHIGGGIGGVAMATAFGPKLYLMMLPSGGRILVDKPALRLPRSIESIPGKVNKRFRRVKRRMQVQRYQSELPAKPWRRNHRRLPRGRTKYMKKNPWNRKIPQTRGKIDEFWRKPLLGGDDSR